MPGTEQNNKRDMMNARLAGGNVETTNFDKVSNGGRTPVPPAPPAPSTAHQDMYKAVTKAPLSEADEQAKRKKQRKQSTLAAIIDGLSALGNVYFATRGANATGTTNLSQGVSGKWKDYWDKVRTDRDAYNKGLLQARQMDYNADVRKLERAEDKAEREAVRAENNAWKRLLREDDRADKSQTQSNWKMTFDANEAHRKTQNENTAKQLEISQQNANTSALNARGDKVAYDRNGKPHYFEDDETADNFARDQGTLGERMIEVETTYTDDYGETKTRKEKKPVTYRKGPNEIKKTGADKKANPMGTDKKPNPMT